MTIVEKIKHLVNDTQWDFGPGEQPATTEKMIIMAYYLGKEEATKDISDKYNTLLAAQRERAEKCRYHNMAAAVIGDKKYIYSPDYAQDMTTMFGGDMADEKEV